mmetsp:Transcript_9973/g.11442  ORF Transcript_9973/g.11442 Transcript_9973/m.11442 type:complete len:588 (+) Transcript_9973:216-1979(+)
MSFFQLLGLIFLWCLVISTKGLETVDTVDDDLEIPTNEVAGPKRDCVKIDKEWYCADETTELTLRGIGLKSKIPNRIDSLVNLEKVDLSNNDLYGRIPEEIGSLQKLTELNLGKNRLSGPIPSSLNNLQKLRILRLNNNSLYGQVPEFENLKLLHTLDVSFNKLRGNFEFGSLRSLETLRINSNNMSGKFFEDNNELGKHIPKIKVLDLKRNRFSGTIVQTIAALKGLETLNLKRNRFSGSIPSSFDSLESLSVLDLARNSFTGTIPNEVMEMDLYYFSASGETQDLCYIQEPKFEVDIEPCIGYEEPEEEELSISDPKFAILLYGSALGVVFLLGCCFACLMGMNGRRRKMNEMHSETAAADDIFVFGVRYGGVLSVVVTLIDLITDVLLASSLLHSETTYMLGLVSFLFIALPAVCNTFIVMTISHQIAAHPQSRAWIQKNDVLLTFIQCLSIFSVEILALASSGICCLTLPMRKTDVYRLRSYSILNNVLEDIPQLVIVVLANLGQSEWVPFSIVAFISSTASLFWTVLFRFQACSLYIHSSKAAKISDSDNDIFSKSYSRPNHNVELVETPNTGNGKSEIVVS